MIPTPGQKVWFECRDGAIPDGTYPAIVVAPYVAPNEGWWAVEIEGLWGVRFAHQKALSPRDDPPPQQEPKREDVGSWNGCVWQPTREVA